MISLSSIGTNVQEQLVKTKYIVHNQVTYETYPQNFSTIFSTVWEDFHNKPITAKNMVKKPEKVILNYL